MSQSRRFARELALKSVCLMIAHAERLPVEAVNDVVDVLSRGGEDIVLDEPEDHTRTMALSIAESFGRNRKDIEKLIGMFVDRGRANMSSMEHSVISTALAEFHSDLKTPHNVLINEYVEVAKIYGAEGGYRLVNGMLDSILKDMIDNSVGLAPSP